MKFKKIVSAVSALAISVSAFVGLGVTAQAETTTLLEYGTSDVAWTAENLATWTAGGRPTLADGIVTISGGNGSYETNKTITPTANSIINVEAVWRGASSTGRAFSAGNGSYFRFGNIIVAQNDQDQKHGYGFTGLDNIGSVTTFTAGSYRVDVTSSTWLKINMEIDTATNTLTSFTIKSEDGDKTYASAPNVTLGSPDYTTVAFGYRKSGGVSTTNKEQLKSVKITQTTQEVQSADYTVRYVNQDGGAEVKATETRTGVVDTTPVLLDRDTASIAATASTPKYVYVSNDASEKSITPDGLTVVTVTYREANTYTATVNAIANGSTIKTYTEQFDEGETQRVYYNKYIEYNGKFYATVQNSAYPYYAHDFTSTDSHDVTYTESDIAYFIEAENIDASHRSRSFAAAGTQPARYSNGGAERMYANSQIWTDVLNANRDAKYEVSIWARNNSSSASESLVLAVKYADGNYSEENITTDTWNAGDQGQKSATIEIPAGCRLAFIKGQYNSNLEIDYIAVRDISPKIAFVEKTGFASETGTSGTLRFSTTFTKSNWPTENAPTLSNVGFAMFDVSTWKGEGTISQVESAMDGYTAGNEADRDKSLGTSGIDEAKPFYYDITGIPSTVEGLGFYAVPYMTYSSGTFWGAPVTFKPNFDWTKYGKTKETVQEGSTVSHTAIATN